MVSTNGRRKVLPLVPLVRRCWFFLRSFFRKTWELEDYPVEVRRQDATGIGSAGVEPFCAQIDGTLIVATGSTLEAARKSLAERFASYRAAHAKMPRPGTRAPVEYAATTEIKTVGSLRNDFIERVLRFNPAETFISDESRLSDFPEPVDALADRIILLYGVDPRVLPDDLLTTIFRAILRR